MAALSFEGNIRNECSPMQRHLPITFNSHRDRRKFPVYIHRHHSVWLAGLQIVEQSISGIVIVGFKNSLFFCPEIDD